jgi:hypothetical protein
VAVGEARIGPGSHRAGHDPWPENDGSRAPRDWFDSHIVYDANAPEWRTLEDPAGNQADIASG